MPTYAIQPESPDAVVIHCSDARFQEAFRNYIADLGIKYPAPIIIPGGVHDLISPARIKAARSLKEQIEFMVKHGGVNRVIIIGHENCQWENRWQVLITLHLNDYTHLLKEAFKLLERKIGVSIQYHYAMIEEGGSITFKQLF